MVDGATVAYIAFLAVVLGYCAGRIHARAETEQQRISSEVFALKSAVQYLGQERRP